MLTILVFISIEAKAEPKVEETPRFLHRPLADVPSKKVTTNGQTVWLRVESVSATPKKIIQFYREQFQKKTRKVPLLDSGHSLILDDPWTIGHSSESWLWVLDPVSQELDYNRWISRLRTFRETGQLSELWVARMVHVYPLSSSRSALINIWTGVDFNLYSFLRANPRQKLEIEDQLGTDVTNLPIPDGGEVVANLSFGEKQKWTLSMIRVALTSKKARQKYIRVLARHGWHTSSQSPGQEKNHQIYKNSDGLSLEQYWHIEPTTGVGASWLMSVQR